MIQAQNSAQALFCVQNAPTSRPACRSDDSGTEQCAGTVLCPESSKPTSDVVFGFLAGRLDENLVRFAVFHQLAQVHIGGVIGAAGGLLHVVGDDDHRVVGLQLCDEFFDLGGGDGVQC